MFEITGELWSQGKEAVDLASMVDYQEDSIVSRTLVEEEGGTVTLFSFAQGQSLSEHSVPFDALAHVLDGEARLTIGGEDVVVGPGQVTRMPANVPHAVRADKAFKMLLAMVRV
jgi:quercetin dioxygenase-like cupin family protein